MRIQFAMGFSVSKNAVGDLNLHSSSRSTSTQQQHQRRNNIIPLRSNRVFCSNSRLARSNHDGPLFSVVNTEMDTTDVVENEIKASKVGSPDSTPNSNNEDNSNNNNSSNPREILVSASIKLPFSADIAFDAFSDLPRQPSWSTWLHSISYIDDENNNNDSAEYQKQLRREEKEKRQYDIDNRYHGKHSNNNDDATTTTSSYIINVNNLRQTKWVMGWKKIRYSWKSKVTFMERPKIIQWETTSGLKNMGTITFEKENGSRSSSSADSGDDVSKGAESSTRMTLTMALIAPRIVAAMMKRSDKIAAFMTSQMLYPSLKNFRRIIMSDDLGMDVSLLGEDDDE